MSNLFETDNIVQPNSDKYWNTFSEHIRTGVDVCFPLTKQSYNKSKDKKWITEGLKRCIKIKEKLYNTWRLNKTAYNEAKYKQYKNILNVSMKTAKNNYFVNKLDLDKTNKTLGRNSQYKKY